MIALLMLAMFDVNDVSVLIPLPGKGEDVAAMPALHPNSVALSLSRTDYETLVPTGNRKWLIEPSFGSDGKPVGGVPNPIYEMDVFKAVGVRVDPCAKDDPQDPKCRVEFRVVLQPVTYVPDVFNPTGPKVVSTVDAAIHLIYDVPEDEKAELFAQVTQLKELAGAETVGRPLGVHPVLAKEGLSGPYATRVFRLIERFARPSALKIATHLFTEHSDRWFFSKTERRGDRLVAVNVPFVGTPSQEVFSTGSPIFTVKNPSTSVDNVNTIVDSIFGGNGKFYQQPASVQTALVDAALRIDNPLRHTPATLDCVSCHCASRAVRRVKRYEYLNLDDGNPNRYRSPEGVTGTLDGMKLDNDYSVRAFGYFFDKVSITKGVVNDSARIADWFNKH